MELPVGHVCLNVFGLTISPPPSKLTLDEELLRVWYYRIYRILNIFSDKWVLYPELDESARLHFHGYFNVTDMVKYKRNINRLREYGFIKIETKFRDFVNWQRYCMKDIQETVKVFGEENAKYIPFDKNTHSLYKVAYEIESDPLRSIVKWLIEDN